MAVSIQDNLVLLRRGAVATLSGCCCCKLPQLPDAVEVQLTSGSNSYSSYVIENPSPRPPYAVGIGFIFPQGTFELAPQPSPGLYYYTNINQGIVSLSLYFRPPDFFTGAVSLELGIALAVIRKKIDESQSPPTLSNLLSDSWGDQCLGLFYPAESNSINQLYRVRKCSIGSGSSTVMASPYCDLVRTCQNNSPSTLQRLDATSVGVISSQRICSSIGCTPPLYCATGHTRIQPLQTDVGSVRLTQNPQFVNQDTKLIISSSGTFHNDDPVLGASGTCTGVVERCSLIYGDSMIDAFPQFGKNRCVIDDQSFGVPLLQDC